MTLRTVCVALGVVVWTGASATNARAGSPEPATATPAADETAPPQMAATPPRTEPSLSARNVASASPRKIWYGGEILAVDVPSLALPFAGILARDTNETVGLMMLSAFAYLFGGPIVHAANGHGASVGEGFALRLGVPFSTELIGAMIGESQDASCRARQAELCGLSTPALGVLGVYVGMLVASAIDISLLAWKVDKDETPASKGRSSRWLPVIGIARDHERRFVATIGVALSM